MEKDDKKIRGTIKDWDVAFSLFLFLSCAALVAYSLKISFDAMEATDAVFYTAPGFAPLIIGIVVAGLAAGLFFGGLKNGGGLGWLSPANLAKIYTSRSFRETFLVFLFLFLYMWLFWENVPFTRIKVPFWFSTFLFLAGMMAAFKAAKIKNIIAISAAATAVIYISFGIFAGIPLP